MKWAIEHFKFYLLGRKFQVETDHKALVAVLDRNNSQREYSSRLTRWRMKLLPFEFDISYIPGIWMGITDYLSRSPSFEAQEEPLDETELILAIIHELNNAKNAAIVNAAISHCLINSEELERKENEIAKTQTERHHYSCQSKVIRRVLETKMRCNEPIRSREESDQLNSLTLAVKRALDLIAFQNQPRQNREEVINSISLINSDNQCRMNPNFDETSSEISNTSVTDKKNDLEFQILLLQARLHHLTRDGQYRLQESTGRVLKYRPDKTTRQAIADLKQELEALNDGKSTLDNVPEQAQLIRPVAGDAKVVVRDVVAKQVGLGNMEGELLAQSLTKVLQIAEATDINTAKWIKETNADPELCLLRQAIINNTEKEMPLNYKLFKGELSADTGLVFVANKLAVPKSLREWVIQVAHGDHLGTDKMEHLTDSVYWPGKTYDLREKAKSCLVCFQSCKNLRLCCPLPKKIRLSLLNTRSKKHNLIS